MAPMINPFDASGYTLAEMTTAINILPNIYTDWVRWACSASRASPSAASIMSRRKACSTSCRPCH